MSKKVMNGKEGTELYIGQRAKKGLNGKSERCCLNGRGKREEK